MRSNATSGVFGKVRARQGSLMAGFTAWPPRPCAGGLARWFGGLSIATRCTAPDRSVRTTPGRLPVSPVAHNLADRQVRVLVRRAVGEVGVAT